MFSKIALFELRFWMRSWMVWIFLLVIGLLFFAAVSSDQLTINGGLSNTFRNAPFVIQNYYALVGLFTLLMSTAFVNSAAIRDFSYNTYQILFSTPMRRRDFLLGRFVGATLVSVIPMLGVSLGILLAKYMPWVDAERFGPVDWTAHLRPLHIRASERIFHGCRAVRRSCVGSQRNLLIYCGPGPADRLRRGQRLDAGHSA